jgi:hypothetical protein
VFRVRSDQGRPSIARRTLLISGAAGVLSSGLPHLARVATAVVLPSEAANRQFSVLYKGDRIGAHTAAYALATGETRVTTEKQHKPRALPRAAKIQNYEGPGVDDPAAMCIDHPDRRSHGDARGDAAARRNGGPMDWRHRVLRFGGPRQGLGHDGRSDNPVIAVTESGIVVDSLALRIDSAELPADAAQRPRWAPISSNRYSTAA